MKDICIPIPHFGENQIAEVEVTVNGKKKKFNYRVESFEWDGVIDKNQDMLTQTEEKVKKLKENIEGYDKSWDLVQIYTPSQGSEHIQVLFRQKQK
ncbi:hypothetical protein ACFLTH_06840 [Bacteroidota bacterium]